MEIKDFYGNTPKIFGDSWDGRTPKVVNKPWGRELWLYLDDRRCYKIIEINANHKTSFQYHLKKNETNLILSGQAEVWLENDSGIIEKKVMGPGNVITVVPPKKHRVVALTDLVMAESSTPEVDDVIRIQDDALRPDGRIESEHKR